VNRGRLRIANLSYILRTNWRTHPYGAILRNLAEYSAERVCRQKRSQRLRKDSACLSERSRSQALRIVLGAHIRAALRRSGIAPARIGMRSSAERGFVAETTVAATQSGTREGLSTCLGFLDLLRVTLGAYTRAPFGASLITNMYLVHDGHAESFKGIRAVEAARVQIEAGRSCHELKLYGQPILLGTLTDCSEWRCSIPGPQAHLNAEVCSDLPLKGIQVCK
jgi:hypothetical protein